VGGVGGSDDGDSDGAGDVDGDGDDDYDSCDSSIPLSDTGDPTSVIFLSLSAMFTNFTSLSLLPVARTHKFVRRT
jgi:hypothetical protein